MVNKISSSVEEAIQKIFDGATIMIGGFGPAGQPAELIDALIQHGAKNLTIINNNAGNGEIGLAALLKAKRVKKLFVLFQGNLIPRFLMHCIERKRSSLN